MFIRTFRVIVRSRLDCPFSAASPKDDELCPTAAAGPLNYTKWRRGEVIGPSQILASAVPWHPESSHRHYSSYSYLNVSGRVWPTRSVLFGNLFHRIPEPLKKSLYNKEERRTTRSVLVHSESQIDPKQQLLLTWVFHSLN